ncbi:hypothetical protein LJR030_003673 [Rhizobium sp. LjRoot30]|uniref:hypothetical protein n=1 Tax=Rhizobium sp. LjRoot30 TaxID=3342320 RepID=UPI003ECC475C
MKHSLVARLDRQLRRRGEWITLRHQTGSTSHQIVQTRGIVKTFGQERLIGGISQTNYMIILSPTDLRNSGFPGAEPKVVPNGTFPPEDPNLPDRSGSVTFRGRYAAIESVDAIYDRDEVVRIEIKVMG